MRGGRLRDLRPHVRFVVVLIRQLWDTGIFGTSWASSYRLAVVIIAVINLFPWSYLHGILKVTVGYYLHTHVGNVPRYIGILYLEARRSRMVPEKYIPTGRIRQHRAQQMSIWAWYNFHVFPNTGLFLVVGLVTSLWIHFSPWFHILPLLADAMLNHELPGIENGWVDMRDMTILLQDGKFGQFASAQVLVPHNPLYSVPHTQAMTSFVWRFSRPFGEGGRDFQGWMLISGVASKKHSGWPLPRCVVLPLKHDWAE